MKIEIERENRNVHFILDCDDVLLDWQRGFRHWIFANCGIRPEVRGPRSWSLFKWLGVPEARCLELIADFNASQAFGELYAMDGAIDAVAKLHQAGHKMTVLTSCSADPVTIQRRKINLQQVFGVMIEDNYKNAMLGVERGNKTFMLQRRHNRDDELTTDSRIVWIDDWRPVISLFS